jgi:hypothetical protein
MTSPSERIRKTAAVWEEYLINAWSTYVGTCHLIPGKLGEKKSPC